MATKKTKDSSQKTIKITFNPLNSAAMEKVVLLKKTSVQLVNGVQQSVIEDLIEGLPQVFSVKKDEIVEVTPEQFKQLYQLGFVETEAEREARINEEKELPSQFGVDPDVKTTSQLNDLYKDKFLMVE
jgi:hypothetical protein